MKTPTQTKFDELVKLAFQDVLKPMGFKKKNNSFYRLLPELGHVVNLQKSMGSLGDHIRFTINTGVFLPEFWQDQHNYFNKPIPTFPSEMDCTLRMRIGELKGQQDVWFDVTEKTNLDTMVTDMKANLEMYILRHFQKLESKAMLVDFVQQAPLVTSSFERLIIYGVLNYLENAQTEFNLLARESVKNRRAKEDLKEYAKKYGLIH
jgi:hypothetical protein